MKYSTSDIRALTTWQAAVLIPGLQAGVTGLIVGILGGTAAALAGENPLLWGFLSGGLVGLWAWAMGISDWRSAIYQSTQPEPDVIYSSSTKLDLRIDWDEGRSGLFDELNITDEQFIVWACGAARGQSLGENHWTGSSNPFSKGQYHAMLNRLMFHGVIRRSGKSKNQGYELSSKGRAVCSAILKRYESLPSPANQSYLPNDNYRL